MCLAICLTLTSFSFCVISSCSVTNNSDKPRSAHDHHLRILNNGSLKTLGALDVDSLDVAVQLLLCALLVVTLAGNADTETVWNALDTGFPDLLVQLGVEADVACALCVVWLVESSSCLIFFSD